MKLNMETVNLFKSNFSFKSVDKTFARTNRNQQFLFMINIGHTNRMQITPRDSWDFSVFAHKQWFLTWWEMKTTLSVDILRRFTLHDWRFITSKLTIWKGWGRHERENGASGNAIHVFYGRSVYGLTVSSYWFKFLFCYFSFRLVVH